MPHQTNIDRRRFIQATVAGTIAAPYIVPSSVLGRGWTAPSERLTLALIGCGGMGNANLNGFLQFDDVQVLAVCDPDRERRLTSKNTVDQKYGSDDCVAYVDYRELLERDDIDAVIQATPDHWHAPVVIHAAEAGKDIYGEKPLSLTIGQGRAMCDAVAANGRVFQTGSQQRSDDRFRYACELVCNGYIGDVKHVTCGLPTGSPTVNYPTITVPEGFDYERWLGPAPWAPYCERRTHWDFRWILDYSGGQVTDWGAHHIDIAHWGLGLTETGPVEVEGTGEFPADGLFDAAVNFDFNATYRNGVVIRVTSHVENGVRFAGDDGWIFVTRGRIEASDPKILRQPIRPNDIHLRRQNGHEAHRREFVDCTRSRRKPIAPIEEAHRTITVAHLGNIAMQLGRPIRWDPDAEKIVGDETAQRMCDRAQREPWGT